MIYEKRTLGSDRVDTVRIPLDVSPELLAAHQHGEYTEVLECYLVLYAPPKQEILQGKLDEIAAVLPDNIATQHPEIYPELTGSEQPVDAGSRRRFGDSLYKANVTVWDRADQWPDAAPALWTKITASGGVEDWIQPTGAHDAYYFGDVRAHAGKVWRSVVENAEDGRPRNVWEPGVYGWEEVT